MAVADAQELRRLIGVVEAEIEKLPPRSSSHEDRQRFTEAVEAAIIGVCMRESGKVKLGRDPETMILGGLRSSCTCGAYGLMTNWINAARNRIGAAS